MRRLAFLLASVALLVGAAVPASAARAETATTVSQPNVIVGVYTYSAGGGWKVTVGYVPCGTTWEEFDYSTDPPTLVTRSDTAAVYYAKIKKGGGMTAEVSAHSITRLDTTIASLVGSELTPAAVAALNADAATYTCTS